MQKLQRLHAGHTAHALFLDGEMLGQSKSPRQDGLLLFLSLNLIGKYVWQADFQQVFPNSFSFPWIRFKFSICTDDILNTETIISIYVHASAF